jgi:hypothetical protein
MTPKCMILFSSARIEQYGGVWLGTRNSGKDSSFLGQRSRISLARAPAVLNEADPVKISVYINEAIYTLRSGFTGLI